MRWILVPPLVVGVAGCGEVGCLDGNDPECVVPSACEAVSFTCGAGEARVEVLQAGFVLPVGPKSFAAPGDVLLANDQIWVVIDALDHPHLLTEAGGTIVDLGTWDGGDSLSQVFQAAGLLPGEAPIYTDLRIIEEGDVKAVQVTGHLRGNESLKIATRYEIRPCEPGIRVRTELVNRSPDPAAWLLLDAWWWGGRSNLPFAPQEDGGFHYPDWGLLTLGDGIRDIPYLASGTMAPPSSVYAEVPCDRPMLSALHGEYVSGAGIDRFVAMPRDYQVFERFIAVGTGPSVSAASDLALELRRQIFGEEWVTISGRLVDDAGDPVPTSGLRASLDVARRLDGVDVPVTQVFPADDGRFSFRFPAGAGDVVIAPFAFGLPQDEATFSVTADQDVGDLVVPAVGSVHLTTRVNATPDLMTVHVYPADDATDAAVRAKAFGRWGECAPLLGLPYGNSPACNVVVADGEADVHLPPGTYDFYASAGPLSNLAFAEGVTVEAGDSVDVTLDLMRAPNLPGLLSADFHVHGAASWDSGTGDLDRVRAFVASGLDVITSTEHNSAWDYAAAIEDLGIADRIELVNGTEATGMVLFEVIPDTLVPKTTGHWNIWPLPFDAENPWRGAFWDQVAMPGALFDRAVDAGWPRDEGVIQLNHPTNALFVGRDFGWADAISLDVTRPYVEEWDGTGHSLFGIQPEGASFRNSDFHTVEVMNGTSNADFLGYRAIWFWMLNEGLLRAGTANSDSHTLSDGVVGTPRTYVFTDQVVGPTFDLAAFDTSVREGRMFGTNGPLVIVGTTDEDGVAQTPSMVPFEPGEDAELHIEVGAAPWVPIDEVRIIVNGEVVRTITEGLAPPADPLLAGAVSGRLIVDVPLAELLPESGDAWIVVEAGEALPLTGDLDCNGIPDTGDNNEDGVVDWRDVDGLEEQPDTECLDTVGPRDHFVEPERGSAKWYFNRVVPGGYSASFTNPLVLDRDGGGYSGVAR